MSFKELEPSGTINVIVRGHENLKLGEDVFLRASRNQKAALVISSGCVGDFDTFFASVGLLNAYLDRHPRLSRTGLGNLPAKPIVVWLHMLGILARS